VLDGELVAFNDDGAPHWPLLCERVLHGNSSIPVTLVVFLLRVDGRDVMSNPWAARRVLLEELGVERRCVRLSEVFDDGGSLFHAVVEHGLEGIVSKKRTGIYRPGYRTGRRPRTRRTGAATRNSVEGHLRRTLELLETTR
jgi:bifunctional non-homologous end joining protein LigD